MTDELYRLQLEFRESANKSRRIRDLGDDYAHMADLLQRIVTLRLDIAEREGLRDIRYGDLAESAEAIVKGVDLGGIRKPEIKRISPRLIRGTCYPGESSSYYADFTPKDFLDVHEEFKAYVKRGFKIPNIWLFPYNVDGKHVYYVIDGHGRSGLANCIGMPKVNVRIF